MRAAPVPVVTPSPESLSTAQPPHGDPPAAGPGARPGDDHVTRPGPSACDHRDHEVTDRSRTRGRHRWRRVEMPAPPPESRMMTTCRQRAGLRPVSVLSPWGRARHRGRVPHTPVPAPYRGAGPRLIARP